METAAFLAAYRSGRRNFVYIEMPGAHLDNVNLSVINLNGADLRNAYLCDADLGWSNLSLVNLSGADLKGANLKFADCSGADFSNADLTDADFTNADLTDADFTGATLNFNSREIIASILMAAASQHFRHRMLAGLILISRDWCWKTFNYFITDPDDRDWITATLASWPGAAVRIRDLPVLR